MSIHNREMADRADMVICYVENTYDGAYRAMCYAKERGKKMVNLAEADERGLL